MSSNQFFLLEKRTGATSDLCTRIEDVKFTGNQLAFKYPKSSWALCELNRSITFGENHFFPQLHDNNSFTKLSLEYGNDGHIFGDTNTDTIIRFNHNHTAFDVLVNYAFGGDKQAALEYLKTL